MVSKKYIRRVDVIAIFVLIASIYITHQSLQVYGWMSNTQELIDQTVPYSRQGGGAEKWLILGDSLAYGVGASSSASSVAGNIGSYFPDATIVNKSESGFHVNDVLTQISDVSQPIALEEFTDILVIVGGNDIVRSVGGIDEVAKDMTQIINILGSSNVNSYIVTMPMPSKVSIVHDSIAWLIDKRYIALDASIVNAVF